MLRLKFLKGILLIIFFQAYTAEISFSQSQKRVVDSLTQLLMIAKEDTAKVNLLNALCAGEFKLANYAKSMSYAKEALSLAQKLGFQRGIGNSLGNIANVYTQLGNAPEAIDNLLKALSIREKIKDKFGIAATYNDLGTAYLNTGDYPAALKYYFLSLKIAEQIAEKRLMAILLNNIGNIYRIQKNYNEALTNHQMALQLAKEIGNENIVCSCYNYIGAVYALKGDYEEALKNFNLYLEKAEQLGKKQSIAEAYNNIGYIYSAKKDYHKAVENYLNALKIHEETKDKRSMAIAYDNLGATDVVVRQYDKAREYFNKGLVLFKEIGNKQGIRDSYLHLSQLDSVLGNNDSSYRYFKLYVQVKDSIINEETNNQLARLKIQYETEKKDKEIGVKNMKIEKQKATIWIVIIGFVLLLSFAFVYFRIYNQKKKASFKHEVLAIKMQALRAQMNPHFTFNILNSIQYYAGENDMKAVQHYLRQFAKLIRMILDQSRASYITLEQEINMLKLYLELEKMRFEEKFKYTLVTDDKLEIKKIFIPGMLIQPIIENAIKHGIEHKEGEAVIEVSFYSRNSTLICTVTDNGIGRAEAMRLHKEEHHQSLATSIISERMEALSSIFNIHLECITEDLMDSEGQPAGTRVIVEIPINNNNQA